jgi:cell division protein FtsL
VLIEERENMMRRYLLGDLSETEQTAFEQELLADRDKVDQVCEIENELIDSYVRGEMKGDDLRRFERYYMRSSLRRERVMIAEQFIADIDQTVEEAIAGSENDRNIPWWRRGVGQGLWPRMAFGAATIIALLLIFGMVWSYLERARLTGEIARLENEASAERTILKQREQELAYRNQDLEREITDERRRGDELKVEVEQLRGRSTSTSAADLSFLLSPASERAEKTLSPFRIPLITERVRLLMALDNDGYANYQIKLQTVEGQDILSRRPVKTKLGSDRTFVALAIQAGELRRGDYVLILFGQTSDGRNEELDRYFFQVF